jgi:hypothetical protein
MMGESGHNILEGKKAVARVKKQHYVPQFYLRRFTDERGLVHVFDKFTTQGFKTPVANVASETGFYDIPRELADGLDDPQIVEKALERVEQGFAKALEDVLEELPLHRRKLGLERKIIHRKRREALAYALAIQIARTRQARNFNIELQGKLLRAIMDRVVGVEAPGISLDDYSLEYKPEFAPLDHARMLFGARFVRALADALFSHIWVLGVNRTSHMFYTSDSPVVKYAHVRNRAIGTSGYGSPGIEVAFPMSPRVILVMWDRRYWKDLHMLDGRGIQLDEQNVSYYNSLQVSQSYRQVYCPGDDFALAEGICSEYPEVCSEEREQVRVV